MKTRKPRVWVKTFLPRFAPLVRDGLKTQTIRPVPKRDIDTPKPGDRISCREWTGRPYNSKQSHLRDGGITGVTFIHIWMDRIRIEGRGKLQDIGDLNRFAKLDGFADFADMMKWFLEEHGLPFTGILIEWTPDA